MSTMSVFFRRDSDDKETYDVHISDETQSNDAARKSFSFRGNKEHSILAVMNYSFAFHRAYLSASCDKKLSPVTLVMVFKDREFVGECFHFDHFGKYVPSS